MAVTIAVPQINAPSALRRVSWVDAAKGLSIVLVVLVHSREWGEFAGIDSDALRTLNEGLATIQIPLFFCVAGLFAHKWLHVSWHELASRKLTALLWVFVAWQPVVFSYKVLAANVLPDQLDSSFAAHLARLVLSPLRPSGELWFLWALALFFVVAKLLRGLPIRLHVLLAGLVSAMWWGVAEPLFGSQFLRVLGDGWRGAAAYYFFFIIGLFGRSIIFRLANTTPRVFLVSILAIWCAVECLAVRVDLVVGLPVAYFFMKCLGLACGISVAVLICRLPGITWLGSRTLQIYVAHTFFIVLGSVGFYFAGVRLTNSPVAFIALLALAAASIAASLLTHYALTRSRFGGLMYEPPRSRGRSPVGVIVQDKGAV